MVVKQEKARNSLGVGLEATGFESTCVIVGGFVACILVIIILLSFGIIRCLL